MSAASAMRQPITGYHRDHEHHWVAELACGHFQHVRHDPPLIERPWVLTEEGRAAFLGTMLDCRKCDEGAPVDHREDDVEIGSRETTRSGGSTMKRFLAVYIGTHDAKSRTDWDALPEADRRKREAAGIAAWHAWQESHGRAVVEQGGPLGKTLRASRDGIAPTRNALTGFVVVEAESHEAAARMFEGHPHFAIFPGEAVEIMEVMPIPGM